MLKVTAEQQTPQPKFAIGQKIKCPRVGTRWGNGQTNGVVTEIHRIFRDNDVIGCSHSEPDIKSICLPFRFDGVTLEIDYPGGDHGSWIEKPKTTIATFYTWGYTIKTKSMCIGVLEKHLRKI